MRRRPRPWASFSLLDMTGVSPPDYGCYLLRPVPPNRLPPEVLLLHLLMDLGEDATPRMPPVVVENFVPFHAFVFAAGAGAAVVGGRVLAFAAREAAGIVPR